MLSATPPTLSDAVRWIAHLGGFLGRIHDGEPGVTTIWHGLPGCVVCTTSPIAGNSCTQPHLPLVTRDI
ncbi:IS4 family transposase [Chloroflexus aurantiacus]|uniref:IS4 family transposase n=1 Tax=Chloroflexus aurantiacus TaxID=1108 RepID=UPI003BF832F2